MAAPSYAIVDYDGVKYLGGGDKIDLNNVNIRAFAKLPGMYPTIGGKILSNVPKKGFTNVKDISLASRTSRRQQQDAPDVDPPRLRLHQRQSKAFFKTLRSH